jgi:WD40 repeat protein
VIKSLRSPVHLQEDRVAFAPASQSLYSVGTNGEVQVYDVNTLELRRSFRVSETIRVVYRVSPDERWIAGRMPGAGQLGVWNVANGELLAEPKGFISRSASLDLAVFSPDSKILAFTTQEQKIALWDIARQKRLRTLGPLLWNMYAISFSPDSRLVAGSTWAGEVRLFEAATGEEPLPPLLGHGSGVHGHCFSPDAATLISGGDDSSVRFWNVATGREMLMIPNAYDQRARLPLLSPDADIMVWQDFAKNLRVRVTAIPTMDEIERAHEAQNTVP